MKFEVRKSCKKEIRTILKVFNFGYINAMQDWRIYDYI